MWGVKTILSFPFGELWRVLLWGSYLNNNAYEIEILQGVVSWDKTAFSFITCNSPNISFFTPIKKDNDGLPHDCHYEFISWKPATLKCPINTKRPLFYQLSQGSQVFIMTKYSGSIFDSLGLGACCSVSAEKNLLQDNNKDIECTLLPIEGSYQPHTWGAQPLSLCQGWPRYRQNNWPLVVAQF